MRRRKAIKEMIGTLLGVSTLTFLGACTHKAKKYDLAQVEECDDLEGLDEAEIAKRKQLGYTEETPIRENTCGNCQLYLPPKEGQSCGGCQLFEGPVFEEAYCTYWAPRVANV
jgi:hypothetical protein